MELCNTWVQIVHFILRQFLNGIHAINVFVDKPFVEVPPDKDANRFRWHSGELFMLYHDWKMHKIEEIIFNCNSGGFPHQHCMDIMIAERIQ